MFYRPGGRIHSCWLGDEVGELGSGWINSATIANPMYSLGAQEGLLKDPLVWRREPPVAKTPFLASDGRTIDSFISVPAVKLFKRIREQAFSLFSMDTSHGHGTLYDFFQKRVNDQLTTIPEDWRNDASRVIWGLVNQLKCRWGTSINKMSSDMYGSVILLPGDSLRIPVGLVGILGPLLKNIPAGRIRYCSPVHEVVWRGRKPRVTLKVGDESLTGDYVIITTSLGVLKSASSNWFNPELPEWKKRVIQDIGYGNLARIILEYKRPFWSSGEGLMRFCWSEKELETRESWSKGLAEIEDVPGTTNKLMTTIGGKEAVAVEGCSEEYVAEEITRIMRQFTGNPSIPYPSALVKSKWNASAFFQGANSFLAEGCSVEDQCTLATPLPGPDAPGPPIVLFAGEATAAGHIGSLLGAHFSGVREADRILKLTKKYGGPPPQEGDSC